MAVPAEASSCVFDPDLIRRYDTAGPRYTSYPTAVQFSGDFTEQRYRQFARLSNEESDPRPLSLYLHIPFCSTLCFYCACNKVVTKNVDKGVDYLERLCHEIELQGELLDNGRPVVQMHFGGGTPTFLSAEQLERLVAHIGRHFRLTEDNARDYSIEIDPRTVSTDTLDRLQQAGFNRISLGVQDFDPVVQQAVHRIQPREDTIQLLQYARSRGFRSTNVDLIYGLPFQSVGSFSRTLDEILEALPDRLSIFNYAHLPSLFAPQQRIHEKDLPDSEEKLRILDTCVERLTGAGYVYIGMDHFARPDDLLSRSQRDGTLHRNFQGYSTHANSDLIGLGVSAISQVGRSYSQNHKDLHAYQADLDASHLATIRGIELTRDDELRRSVIEQLMCFGQVSLRQVLQAHHIDQEDYFEAELTNLQPMASDGLLTVKNDDLVEVSSAGRFLLRNICMVFDCYLGHTPGRPRHSRVI
ncbi:MAG TPA: oxygen-independent coproporphyrinogen III oxidase [Gammaproteobacteria bacterium]|jgi:oxygen-independent coproporphyrinogen-3 oxidase|nr:oxygen-independent coproporphyrinogen III oxidase [Arenicellales bacterium]HCV20471.1 oxygen-independent coproporphyrinogen III oxidase [Gammaproteobacteria bacterium]MDP6313329.1 oxygen-independent coproporphyrinogen III oxidase [Arenicellales bacterium]MDP7119782.1 oxygen-independent coproporphyrinogen III oxidase [Arenicellales bacterium]MDP7192620.1 oxygen-independent coproporphyrinogen III oxidase [Arenicellales bacterium]